MGKSCPNPILAFNEKVTFDFKICVYKKGFTNFMLNLKCAVLVTKANDKSSPLTPHLAEVPKFTASSALRGERGWTPSARGLAEVPDLRTDLIRQVQVLRISK